MIQSGTGTPRRSWHIALLVALMSLTLGTSAVLAQSAEPGAGSSGDPGSGVPTQSGQEEPVTPDDEATLVEPNPDLLDPQPTGWDRIEVAPDGRTLTVYFWSGIPDCYGLQRVDVVPADGGVDVQLYTGLVPPGDQVCIQIAQLYKTVVELEAPVIGGGVAP
jgi:hypothetical protein